MTLITGTLLSNGITSRWIIFLIEEMIVTAALAIALLLASMLTPYLPSGLLIAGMVILNILISGIGFLVLKTHHGIIRFSELRDIVNILRFGIFQIIAGVTIIYFYGYASVPEKVAYFVAAVNTGFSIIFLIGFRLMVKHTYSVGFDHAKPLEKVLIYGAGDRGMAIEKAIADGDNAKMMVIGFIEDDPNKVGKLLNGKKIFSGNNDSIRNAILQNEIGRIIISASLTTERKKELANICTENSVNISTLPAIQEWISGDLNLSKLREIHLETLLGPDEIPLLSDQTIKELSGAKIMVTGAAGSIGKGICRELCRYPIQQIILVDQSESGLHDALVELKKFNSNIDMRMELANIREVERIERMMERAKPEFIFHTASFNHANTLEKFPAEVVLTNIKGTKIMADTAIKNQVRKFVLVSSAKSVNPTNFHGLSKLMAELYVRQLNQQSKTDFITVRFGNVLGTNYSVDAIFTQQIEAGGPVKVADTEVTRYFMGMADACNLILESCILGKNGDSFLFDMGSPVKLIDIAKQLIQLAGKMPGKPIDIEITGLRAGEKLFEELLTDSEKLLRTNHSRILKIAAIEVDARFITVMQEIIDMADRLDDNLGKRMKEILNGEGGIIQGASLRYIRNSKNAPEDFFTNWKISNQ